MQTDYAQILPIALPTPKAGLVAPDGLASPAGKMTSSSGLGADDLAVAADEGQSDSPSDKLSAFDQALAQMMMVQVQAPVAKPVPQAPSQQGLTTNPIDMTSALAALESGVSLPPSSPMDATSLLNVPEVEGKADQASVSALNLKASTGEAIFAGPAAAVAGSASDDAALIGQGTTPIIEPTLSNATPARQALAQPVALELSTPIAAAPVLAQPVALELSTPIAAAPVLAQPVTLGLSTPDAPTSRSVDTGANTAPDAPTLSIPVQARSDRPSQASILQAMGSASSDSSARVVGTSLLRPAQSPSAQPATPNLEVASLAQSNPVSLPVLDQAQQMPTATSGVVVSPLAQLNPLNPLVAEAAKAQEMLPETARVMASPLAQQNLFKRLVPEADQVQEMLPETAKMAVMAVMAAAEPLTTSNLVASTSPKSNPLQSGQPAPAQGADRSAPQPITTQVSAPVTMPEPDDAQSLQLVTAQAPSGAAVQSTLQAASTATAQDVTGARLAIGDAGKTGSRPTIAATASNAPTSAPATAAPLPTMTVATDSGAGSTNSGGAFEEGPSEFTELDAAKVTQSNNETTTDLFSAPLPLEGRVTQASLQQGSSPSLSTGATAPHLAAEISRKFEGKSAQFDISLTPEGLGKVDVKITINARGEVSAAMRFDNPQAAAELKSRASELQRALEQSGFNLSQEGISFTDGQGQGFGAPQQQASQQDWQEAARRTAQTRMFQDTSDLADATALKAAEASSAYSRRSSTGVDVRI